MLGEGERIKGNKEGRTANNFAVFSCKVVIALAVRCSTLEMWSLQKALPNYLQHCKKQIQGFNPILYTHLFFYLLWMTWHRVNGTSFGFCSSLSRKCNVKIFIIFCRLPLIGLSWVHGKALEISPIHREGEVKRDKDWLHRIVVLGFSLNSESASRLQNSSHSF